jgi:hypothetical protein
MIKEVQINIIRNGQWNNLKLKNKYGLAEVDGKKKRVVKEQGINPGEYIIIKKKQLEGKEMPVKFYKDEAKTKPIKSYMCIVEYLDQDCSFFLDEKSYGEYLKMPVGVPFKLGVEVDSYFNQQTGQEVPFEVIRISK